VSKLFGPKNVLKIDFFSRNFACSARDCACVTCKGRFVCIIVLVLNAGARGEVCGVLFVSLCLCCVQVMQGWRQSQTRIIRPSAGFCLQGSTHGSSVESLSWTGSTGYPCVNI